MTAAEYHRDPAGKKLVGEAYVQRGRELLALSDDELVGGHYCQVSNEEQRRAQAARKAASVRRILAEKNAEDVGEQFWTFGIMNYPLPH